MTQRLLKYAHTYREFDFGFKLLSMYLCTVPKSIYRKGKNRNTAKDKQDKQ